MGYCHGWVYYHYTTGATTRCQLKTEGDEFYCRKHIEADSTIRVPKWRNKTRVKVREE